MALYRVTVKQRKVTGGIYLEPGMTVEFSTNYIGNPIVQNGGNDVANAFMRVYGINLKSIGALNTVYLGVVQVG